jgi:predicted site-specific integrase-resolvase
MARCRYELSQLLGIKAELPYTIGYCRVSSHDQKEDLATDVLKIITVFSARLYGSRSHKNKKIVDVVRG